MTDDDRHPFQFIVDHGRVTLRFRVTSPEALKTLGRWFCAKTEEEHPPGFALDEIVMHDVSQTAKDALADMAQLLDKYRGKL